MENKYIKIQKSIVSDKAWSIINKKSGEKIGYVEYYAPWSQYVFAPNYGTVWNNDCLETVKQFVNKKSKELE